MSSGEWYYDAVAYVYEKGLMDGTSAVTFDPGAVLTRAMTAQVLWNLAGGLPPPARRASPTWRRTRGMPAR